MLLVAVGALMSVAAAFFITSAPAGHTWHHPDDYLFAVTKYGIEAMIKNTYPNNMPAYEDQLSDREIIAVLSYIKSQWPRKIQRQHDQISQRSSNQ